MSTVETIFCRYSDLESRMKDELMNVKIKFTEQSQTVAELKQEISRLETKVSLEPKVLNCVNDCSLRPSVIDFHSLPEYLFLFRKPYWTA